MKRLLRIVTNKFLLTGIAFGVWMMYFDQNDWISIKQRRKELQSTKDNIAYLSSEIGKMQQEHTDMVTSPQKLEQFARENFKMKRDTEDLYIIEHK